MTIDNTPAIKAFVQERMKTVDLFSAFEELRMIVTLCDGLTKQNEMLASALNFPTPCPKTPVPTVRGMSEGSETARD
jgi:hypothetical protein